MNDKNGRIKYFPNLQWDLPDMHFADNLFKKISAKFSVTIVDNIPADLTHFVVFEKNRINDSNVIIQIGGGRRTFYIALLNISNEIQIWGIAPLQKYCPHILIRQKTFADRLTKFISRTGVRFADDKEFTKSFFIASDDVPKAALLMNTVFRNYLQSSSANKMIVEISGNILIAGNEKLRAEEDADWLISFLEKLPMGM